MYLSKLIIKGHPILKDLELSFINKKTKEKYSIIAFVGENGCGKTTLLNELFNYNESEYIQEKESVYDVLPRPLNVVYLRQGSLHKNAMKEVGKLIDGKDMYPVNSASFDGGLNPFGLVSNNGVNRVEKGLSILEQLGDDQITEIFKGNHLGEVYCSEEVSKKIDGKTHGYNISNYSSGQQEILLKLKDLKTAESATDCILLDEPETSLHPRWQKEILNIIQSITESGGIVPQIFLATHSEKVLESLIGRDDALIIRLFKEDGKIKHEDISEMDLRLPKATFAELDYVVFHIPSLDYHDQLFTYFGSFFDKDTSTGIDLKIERKCERRFGKNNINQYKKERVNARFNRVYATKMLPTYIRDYFHHPAGIEPPTEDEIIKSIELLRDLIEFMNQKGVKEIEETE